MNQPPEQAETRGDAAPLIEPNGRCFHCGTTIAASATSCSGCGQAPGLTAESEPGYLSYLLRAFERMVATGQLTNSAADRLTLPYRQRLGLAPAPRTQITALGAGPMAPRTPVNFFVVWANVLLYLGGFFVFVSSFVFAIVAAGLPRAILVGVLATLFLVGGLICRKIAIVRTAGSIFTAVGALLVPLDFAAIVAAVADSGPLSTNAVWLVAGISCTILYVAFAALGMGWFYRLLALVAISNVFAALFALADWQADWLAAWFTLQALVIAALDSFARRVVQRLFGIGMLLWSVTWTVIAIVATYAVNFLSEDSATTAWAVAGLLATVLLFARYRPNRVAPAIAGILFLHLVAATTRWLIAPVWVGGIATTIAAGFYVGYWRWRRSATAGRSLLVLGILAALLAACLPLYDRADEAGVVAGLVATAVLITAALLADRGALIFAAGLTSGAGWWHLARLLPNPNPTASDLGLVYLPLPIIFYLAAMVIPTRKREWTITLSLVALGYSLFVATFLAGDRGRLVIALGLFTLTTAVGVVRWRRPWLVSVPAVWLICLIGAADRLLGLPAEAALPIVLTLGFSATAAGFVIGEAFRDWSLAGRLVGLAYSAVAFIIGLGIILTNSQDRQLPDVVGHLNGLALLASSILLGLEGLSRRLLFYPASGLAMAAVLWETDVFAASNLQAYAAPLGVYLIAVAVVSARDRLLGSLAGPLSSLAWLASAATLGGASFIQTFDEPALPYEGLLLAEGFAYLALGAFVRRRVILTGAVSIVVLAGLRLMFEVPEYIPFILCFGGFFLIAGGFVALLLIALRNRGRLTGGQPE